ncbi:MAG: hypothetical protein ACHQF2_01675 [Flavobacteriales bacterium]
MSLLIRYKNHVLFQLLVLITGFKILQLFFLFFFYTGFETGFSNFHLGSLSFTTSPFHSFSICLSALVHPVVLISLLLVYGILFFPKKTAVRLTYHSAAERMLVCAAVWLLAWELTTTDYNFYLDSAFFLDRFLLLGLAVLVWRFPILVPLFTAFAFMYRSQFNYPIGGFSLADKRILFDILILYTTCSILKKHMVLPARTFLFLAFCLVASYYIGSGINKMIISPHGHEWVTQNNLNDFFFNAHARGWMAGLPDSSLKGIYSFLESYGVAIQLVVLLIEIAALFLLWKRKMAITLLLLCMCLHIGIFLGGSMLFWKWIAIDLVLIFILLKYKEEIRDFFSKTLFRYSLLVVLSSALWLRPSAIGWHDTPLNQFFTYEVVDEQNKTYAFSKNSFAPYDAFFQTDVFYYLIKNKLIPISGFGYTGHYTLAHAIKQKGKNGLPEIENKYGQVRYHAKKREAFIRFIRTFFRNKNKNPGHVLFFNLLGPPHHLNNGVYGVPFCGNTRVKKVKVYFNQTWRNRSKIIRLKTELCEEIDIPI